MAKARPSPSPPSCSLGGSHHPPPVHSAPPIPPSSTVHSVPPVTHHSLGGSRHSPFSRTCRCMAEPFGWICNPAEVNISICNASPCVCHIVYFGISNAYIRCGRIANPTKRRLSAYVNPIGRLRIIIIPLTLASVLAEKFQRKGARSLALPMPIFAVVGLQIRPNGGKSGQTAANPTKLAGGPGTYGRLWWAEVTATEKSGCARLVSNSVYTEEEKSRRLSSSSGSPDMGII